MSGKAKRTILSLALCGVGLAMCLMALYPSVAGDQKPQEMLKSKVVRFDEARSHLADWGEMRFYFTGQTLATKDVLTAVAIVEPGKAVHRAHRHSHEEYLVLVDGEGAWSLDGKELPAKRGDVLFVEPWVYHGLTNTSDEELIFLVIRYNGKGVEMPPRPDDRPDEL